MESTPHDASSLSDLLSSPLFGFTLLLLSYILPLNLSYPSDFLLSSFPPLLLVSALYSTLLFFDASPLFYLNLLLSYLLLSSSPSLPSPLPSSSLLSPAPVQY